MVVFDLDTGKTLPEKMQAGVPSDVGVKVIWIYRFLLLLVFSEHFTANGTILFCTGCLVEPREANHRSKGAMAPSSQSVELPEGNKHETFISYSGPFTFFFPRLLGF